MIKKLLLSVTLLTSLNVTALEYAGQYTVSERPERCFLVAVCHENEYRKIQVILERRSIKLIGYKTNNYDIYAVFDDLTVNKRLTQKACPTIIDRIGKSYKVTYDPYKKSYFIDCKHFN